MPDIKITVGNREFDVACQEGEEHFLKSAAAMLNVEAEVMVQSIRHLTESRMLLMAGLMLADKTAGLDDDLKIAEGKIAALEAEVSNLRAQASEGTSIGAMTDTLSAMAAQAEAIAAQVEEKAAG
ncbi:MAG: cell division protein ZapA [Maritimibacter sp.]